MLDTIHVSVFLKKRKTCLLIQVRHIRLLFVGIQLLNVGLHWRRQIALLESAITMTTAHVTCLSTACTDNDRLGGASRNGTAGANFLLIAKAHGESIRIRKAIAVIPAGMTGDSTMLANYS